MSDRIRLLLDVPPSLGGFTIFQLDKERLEYVQPGLWYQLLYHRFRAAVTINGRTYEREADGFALIPPRAVFAIRRLGPPGKLFQAFFQPHAEAAYPLLFDQVFAAGEVAESIDLLFCRAGDRMLVKRSHLQTVLWTTLCHFGSLAIEVSHPMGVQRLEIYIDDHLSESFTMQELAELNDMSHSTLIRLAKEHWGVTPQEYVRNRRMERAAELLVSSPMSIKQVAAAVGIADLHRFNKLVRGAFQMSPRSLREMSPSPNLHEQRRK